MPPVAASIGRLFSAESDWRQADAGVEIGGAWIAAADVTRDRLRGFGEDYLFRQGTSLGGGSTEMARNMISEGVLGMPRGYRADHNIPFKDVKGGR
jgi:alkylation response protein AidB-like acyl-CoA dehydrogenase